MYCFKFFFDVVPWISELMSSQEQVVQRYKADHRDGCQSDWLSVDSCSASSAKMFAHICMATVVITSSIWMALAQNASWCMIQCIFTASPPLLQTLLCTMEAIPFCSPIMDGAPSIVMPQSLAQGRFMFSIAHDTASKRSFPVVVLLRLFLSRSSSEMQKLLSTPRKKIAVSVRSVLSSHAIE